MKALVWEMRDVPGNRRMTFAVFGSTVLSKQSPDQVWTVSVYPSGDAAYHDAARLTRVWEAGYPVLLGPATLHIPGIDRLRFTDEVPPEVAGSLEGCLAELRHRSV